MKRGKIKAGRPPKAKAAQLGDHVIGVADSLFIERGYGGTSMAEVAARARVAKLTLYRRYPDKAALFREVIRRRIDAIAATPGTRIAAIDPLEELKALGLAALNQVLEPAFLRLHRVIIGEVTQFPELGLMVADNWGSGFVDQCVAALKRAQAQGRCRAGDADAMALTFLSGLVGEVFYKALAGSLTLTTAAARDAHLDAVWDVFMKGVAV